MLTQIFLLLFFHFTSLTNVAAIFLFPSLFEQFIQYHHQASGDIFSVLLEKKTRKLEIYPLTYCGV